MGRAAVADLIVLLLLVALAAVAMARLVVLLMLANRTPGRGAVDRLLCRALVALVVLVS